MKKLRWTLGATVLASAGAVVLRKRARARRSPPARAPGRLVAPLHERRADPDPLALRAMTQGPSVRVGLDLARLKGLQSPGYQPLMEYLNYIQVQRGASESLLFVRLADLDELAGLAGQSRDQLTQEFKKLGVLLSMN